MKRLFQIASCMIAAADLAAAADPVRTAWISSPAGQPGIHSVAVHDSEIEVRSAGISLQYLGPLQVPPAPADSVREFVFRIPRHPEAQTGRLTHVPLDIAGIFLNGVPIYNQFESLSYNGANLWHYDPLHPRPGDTHVPQPGLLEKLATDTGRHSPLIGFALDGFPVYGPWTDDRRMRSSYRLRALPNRHQWPDGTILTPEQYGPDVTADDPAGTFAEDYEYAASSGDLDQCNGRFTRTPEYPDGTYAYFLTPDAFPYLIGPCFHGKAAAPDSTRFFPLVTRGNLTVSASVSTFTAGQEFRLRFQGPTRHFEFVHERPIHLLVASEDLETFDHIHPQLVPGDVYEVAHTFPHGGRYRLWADFSLPGEAPRVESFDVTVAGPPATKSTATLETLQLQAGVDVPIQVKLPAGCQPYLGAWAHVIVISQDLATFSHAHPLETVIHSHTITGPSPEDVTVMTNFPRAGVYRMWAQYQQQGKPVTVPYRIQVSAAPAPKSTQAIPPGAISIRVTQHGYQPATLQLPAGQEATLAFTREGAPNCGSEVVFPALGIRKKLPLNETVLVHLPPQPAGEIAFSCGMGMFKGMIVARSPYTMF